METQPKYYPSITVNGESATLVKTAKLRGARVAILIAFLWIGATLGLVIYLTLWDTDYRNKVVAATTNGEPLPPPGNYKTYNGVTLGFACGSIVILIALAFLTMWKRYQVKAGGPQDFQLRNLFTAAQQPGTSTVPIIATPSPVSVVPQPVTFTTPTPYGTTTFPQPQAASSSPKSLPYLSK